ncbi:hypothetical protein HK405_011132, partial [Cladochytrium tenue]
PAMPSASTKPNWTPAEDATLKDAFRKYSGCVSKVRRALRYARSAEDVRRRARELDLERVVVADSVAEGGIKPEQQQQPRRALRSSVTATALGFNFEPATAAAVTVAFSPHRRRSRALDLVPLDTPPPPKGQFPVCLPPTANISDDDSEDGGDSENRGPASPVVARSGKVRAASEQLVPRLDIPPPTAAASGTSNALASPVPSLPPTMAPIAQTDIPNPATAPVSAAQAPGLARTFRHPVRPIDVAAREPRVPPPPGPQSNNAAGANVRLRAHCLDSAAARHAACTTAHSTVAAPAAAPNKTAPTRAVAALRPPLLPQQQPMPSTTTLTPGRRAAVHARRVARVAALLDADAAAADAASPARREALRARRVTRLAATAAAEPASDAQQPLTPAREEALRVRRVSSVRGTVAGAVVSAAVGTADATAGEVAERLQPQVAFSTTSIVSARPMAHPRGRRVTRLAARLASGGLSAATDKPDADAANTQKDVEDVSPPPCVAHLRSLYEPGGPLALTLFTPAPAATATTAGAKKATEVPFQWKLVDTPAFANSAACSDAPAVAAPIVAAAAAVPDQAAAEQDDGAASASADVLEEFVLALAPPSPAAAASAPAVPNAAVIACPLSPASASATVVTPLLPPPSPFLAASPAPVHISVRPATAPGTPSRHIHPALLQMAAAHSAALSAVAAASAAASPARPTAPTSEVISHDASLPEPPAPAPQPPAASPSPARRVAGAKRKRQADAECDDASSSSGGEHDAASTPPPQRRSARRRRSAGASPPHGYSAAAATVEKTAPPAAKRLRDLESRARPVVAEAPAPVVHHAAPAPRMPPAGASGWLAAAWAVLAGRLGA